MFARQGMYLLEFAARLCTTDYSGGALASLSQSIFEIEPRYSTRLPGVCADFEEFDLPYKSSKGDELLWAIFDLIRNGQAHRYQQVLVNLTDGVDWQIYLTGASMGQHLQFVSVSPRHVEHLGYRRDQGDLWLVVRPDVIFLDVKNAIAKSGLLGKGLEFRGPPGSPLKFPSSKKEKLAGPFYQFDSAALEMNLSMGGHKKIGQ